MTASTHTPRSTPCACGSDEFVITEETCHFMRLQNGRLDAIGSDCGGALGDSISCAHCGTIYSAEQFAIGDL